MPALGAKGGYNPGSRNGRQRVAAGKERRMTKILSMLAAAALVAAVAPAGAEEAKPLKSDRDRTSYALGVEVGGNLKRQGIDVDVDLLLRGMKDAMTGGPTLLTETEVRETVMALQRTLMAKQEEVQKAKSAKAKSEGEAFLVANAAKQGVVKLPSGLQYKVIIPGGGASPKATDTVTVHYRGTLIDGTEFDSSYKRNEPTSFPVGGVIKGWTEALQLMKVGAKWELYIPAELAYGDRGAGGLIPPGAALIFEVELLGIK